MYQTFVLSNERFKVYQTGFLFCRLSYAPGGTLGRWMPRGQKLLFQTWSCGISNLRGCRAEQNASKISSYGQTGDLGVRSKGQISLNFDYQVNSKFFVPNFVCVLSNKRYKTY